MSESNPIHDLLEKYKDMLHPQMGGACVGPGWALVLKGMFAIIHHHIGRWDEVVRIKESVLARGETPLPWIAEYFATNLTDPFETFKVVQIKSKFGGLRFYVENGDDFIRGVIAMGETLADATCDMCGVFPVDKCVCPKEQ